MKTSFENIAVVGALALALPMVAASSPALADRHGEPDFCNPVYGNLMSDIPAVSAAGTVVRHGDSFACPPAPQPPAPQVSRDFLVFFDFDDTAITPDAAQTIGDAAQAAATLSADTVVVTGHTDTSGSPAYNLRLSEARATAAAQELIYNGVTAGQVVTQGLGETDLLVPTADGVREPSNRRAEIVIE